METAKTKSKSVSGFTSMFSEVELNRVIKISRILSPTPVDDNAWRNMIYKSLTNEPFSVRDVFDLGRFTERMWRTACDIMSEGGHSKPINEMNEKDKDVWEDYSSTLGYKQYLQSKFHKL